MAKKKADKVEMSKRIRAVQEWILQGQLTCDIITQVCNQWNIGERAAYNLFNYAWNELQELNQKSLEASKAFHVQARMKIYRDLKEKNTPSGSRAALRILDSIAQIDGVFPTRGNQAGFGTDNYGDVDDDSSGAIMKLPDGTEIEV